MNGGRQGRAVTVWLTGLSGAGKSTIAQALAARMRESGVPRVEVLDGDEVRENLSAGLGFSKADRNTNVRRIAWVCHLLTRNGVSTIAAAISPYRESRDAARALIADFVEVFVDAPLDVVERRDVKGLYQRARAGAIANFTGVSDPYEPPPAPEVRCPTDAETPEASVERILARLRELRYLPPPPPPLWTAAEEAEILARLGDLRYLDAPVRP